eukprot:gene616-10310_t
MNESGEEMHSNNLRGEERNTDRTASDFAIGETVSNEEKEILKLIKEKMENPNSLESENLRAMDRKKVKEKLEVVNEVIDKVIKKWKEGKLKSEGLKDHLERKYHVWNKGVTTVIEELKQRIKAKNAKIKKYEERNNQYIQHRLFQTNQRLLFEKIEGVERENYIKPDADQSKAFWSDIWSKDVVHNSDASWIKEVEKQVENVAKQSDVKVTLHSLQLQLR